MVNLVPLLVIGALVCWFARRKKRSRKGAENPTPVLVDAQHGVFVRPDSADEQRIAALHREATEHKGKKEWDKAIACLREAERLKGNVLTVYPVKHSLRLPLFLQQAGRFDEAMREFQALLDDTESRVLRNLPKRNVSSKTMLTHAEYAEIYAAMSTACKREKHMEQAEEYKDIAEAHDKKHARLLEAEQRRDAKKFAERKKKREARH